MIQKAGNILLAVLVLCTTTGMVVNQHYSNGELYSASLYSSADSCCENDVKEVKTCHEETKVYKVKDYFRASNAVSIKAQVTLIIQTIKITELFDFTRPLIDHPFKQYKLHKPKIPLTEFIQVFIL